MRAGNHRARKERNGRMSMAWHIAAWTRASKMPRHREVIEADGPKRARRQSWQERMAIAQQWQAVTKR